MYLLSAMRHNLRRGGNEQGQGRVRLGKGGGGGGGHTCMCVYVIVTHIAIMLDGCTFLWKL